MSRHPTSTHELDSAESAWWSDNGDLEAEYCWVQTPKVRRVLRGGYLRRISRLVPPGGRVLELGCGSGWVGLELVASTGCRLVGLDASPGQVERARAAAERAGLADRATFRLDGPGAAAGPPPDGSFDLVVMHAFVHHLATEEIRAVLAEASAWLRPGGAAVLLEPVVRDGAADPAGPAARWLALEEKLRILPTWAFHRRMRRMGPAERAARQRLGSRPLPEPPFGPSPKETPFDDGELERLIDEAGLCLEEVTPVMCMSHLVAQELLLAGLSQPRLWSALTPPILALARHADQRALGAAGRFWTFELFVARAGGGA